MPDPGTITRKCDRRVRKQVIAISANLSDPRVTAARVPIVVTHPARTLKQFRSIVGSEFGNVEVAIRSSRAMRLKSLSKDVSSIQDMQ